MNDDQLVESAQELLKTLTPMDLDHTLGRITTAAVESLPDVDYASITVRHVDGTLETVAPTDEMLCDLDAKQYELREGPCYEAATDAVHITAPDLATDQRFPNYGEVALQAGIRAQAGLRLFDAPTSQGALNLYSRTSGTFSDFSSVAALFSHQSAMVIEYAREIQNLQAAVRDRDIVGRAVGIAMERYELPDKRAFALLTRLSLHHNVGLPVVAEAIITASESRTTS
jgi:GAF domain-containing protein